MSKIFESYVRIHWFVSGRLKHFPHIWNAKQKAGYSKGNCIGQSKTLRLCCANRNQKLACLPNRSQLYSAVVYGFFMYVCQQVFNKSWWCLPVTAEPRSGGHGELAQWDGWGERCHGVKRNLLSAGCQAQPRRCISWCLQAKHLFSIFIKVFPPSSGLEDVQNSTGWRTTS